jgi:Flp pilus assembly protein TadB
MMDDHNNSDNRIIVRRVIRNKETGATEEEIFRASQPGPAARWLTYLLLVPVLIVMVVLGIFFFTAFLALFAVVAAGFGLRLWWLRRKLRESMQTAEAEYNVIEDAEIVEETKNKPNNKASEANRHERQ